jgi:hypothetical protein
VSPRAKLVYRPCEPGDEARVLEAFNRAFAASDADFVPRTPAQWRWRYLENPDGARSMLACDEAGAVVAQYAGLGQSLQAGGERLRASQSVDSFVDSRWRALGHSGVFARTGVAFAEHFGGDAPDRDVLMWGLPAPAAWRIGARRLDYGFVRSVLQLSADPARIAPAAAGAVEVAPVAAFDEEFDALFERTAPQWGIVARRDAVRLSWRYLQRPGAPYRIAAARENGRLSGWAVLAQGRFEGRAATLLVDVLHDRAGRAGDALLAWAAEEARAHAPQPLIALLPEHAPEWLAWQRAGMRVAATRYSLVARSWRPSLAVEDLRERFWMTLGDTDLV